MKKNMAFAILGALLSIGLANSAAAQVNGNFETGDFTGWTTVGDALVLGSNLGTAPAEGSYDAFVASQTDGSGNAAVPAGIGVDPGTAEMSLGIANGSLVSVGNGSALLTSAITQSMVLTAGQTITFQWDFLTNQTYFDGTAASFAPDANNNDFAFATLAKVGSSSVTKLADTFYGYAVNPSSPAGFDSGFTATSFSNPFFSETGFHTTTLTVTSAGTYVLGLGVAHASLGPDDGINSALLLDNIQVQTTPEPASIVGLSALCLGLLRRRSIRK